MTMVMVIGLFRMHKSRKNIEETASKEETVSQQNTQAEENNAEELLEGYGGNEWIYHSTPVAQAIADAFQL